MPKVMTRNEYRSGYLSVYDGESGGYHVYHGKGLAAHMELQYQSHWPRYGQECPGLSGAISVYPKQLRVIVLYRLPNGLY